MDFDIRMMRDEEAVQVSRCVYRTYGYSYGKEHAYFPERIVELNRDGLMISAVAATGDDEMAGHCALMKDHPDDPIAEFGMAVVKPRFRGHGCMNDLSAMLLERARTTGLTGVFAHAVANHPYSQKALHKFGFHDCAILLGNVPLSMSFKGIAEELSQRDSHVISFLYLNRPGSLTVHAPPHHGEIIRKLYGHIDLHPTYVVPEDTGNAIRFQRDDTILKTKVNAPRGIAYVEVMDCGKDVLDVIRTTLKDLCLKRIDVIYVYLSLQDPLTSRVTPGIEKLGFFFGGIFPGKTAGDALILQYLNNVPLDYGKIVVASDMAGELLGYIKDRDHQGS